MNTQVKPSPVSLFTNELCLFYLRIEDYEHAYQTAGFILNDDPSNKTALYVLGAVYEVRDNLPMALQYYDAILNNYPHDAKAMKRKAYVEMHLHMELEALQHINISIELDKNDAESYLIRGMIYFHYFAKKLDAIVDYNEALRLDPQNVMALFNRGYAYLKYGNKNYARDDFSRAAELGYGYAGEMLDQYFASHQFSTAS